MLPLRCRFCGVVPYIEGPHHDIHCPRCVRKEIADSRPQEDCPNCGEYPARAGMHHQQGCSMRRGTK